MTRSSSHRRNADGRPTSPWFATAVFNHNQSRPDGGTTGYNRRLVLVYNGGVYMLLRPFEYGDTDIYLQVDGHEEKIPFVKFEGCRNAVPAWEDATTSFALGWALTVHKVQGSEWNKVVLIDEYSMRDDCVRWLYTGITRAAQQIIIVRR